MLVYRVRILGIRLAETVAVCTGAIIAVFLLFRDGIWPIVAIEKNLCGANKSRAVGIET